MRKNRKYLMMAEEHEKKGDFKNARKFYEKSLRLSPSEKTHEKLALMLNRCGDVAGAKANFLRALEFNPNNATCIYNLGILERVEGSYDSSMKRYLFLKKIGVQDSVVDMSIGVLFSEMGEPRKALESYENALKKGNQSDILLFNYSLCMMALGNYEEGLRLYERRIWHARPPGEEWRGEEDVNVLVSPEQGNGDIIQFSRYVPELRKKCKKTVLLCNATLVNLMRTLHGIDEVIEFNPGDEFVQVEEEGEDSVPYGKFIRIMSIPHVLGINPIDQAFKRQIFADKDRSEEFKKRMPGDKLKVGLCWQGGRKNSPETIAIDRRRSIPLSDMSPIFFKNEEVEFYSLQKNEDKKEFPLVDFMEESRDFYDTAAIVENLDLVISVDTAVAHLSASMEKPTWILSRKGGCWRWGFEGESTFWYPSMRIFRQEKIDCWDSTILRVAEELKKFVHVQKGARN